MYRDYHYRRKLRWYGGVSPTILLGVTPPITCPLVTVFCLVVDVKLFKKCVGIHQSMLVPDRKNPKNLSTDPCGGPVGRTDHPYSHKHLFILSPSASRYTRACDSEPRHSKWHHDSSVSVPRSGRWQHRSARNHVTQFGSQHPWHDKHHRVDA